MNHTFAFAGFIAVLLWVASPALAGQELGPATPQSLPGKISLGGGCCYQASEWETGVGYLDMSNIRQSIWYASLAYGFAANWEGYFSAGAAGLTGKKSSLIDYVGGEESFPLYLPRIFETGYEPYFSLGLRGMFYRQAKFAVGACFQYNYNYNHTVEKNDAAPIFGEAYDAGAFYYKAAGKAAGRAERIDEAREEFTFSTDIEERGVVGVNAGLRINVREGWNMNVEVRYRSMSSISMSLNRAFGA